MKIMEQLGVAGLHTKELIEKLQPLEMRSWAEFGKRRAAIRDTEVAELLAPYGLKPKQLKIGAINRRGYKLEEIKAAAERHIHIPEPEIPEDLYPATFAGDPQESSGFEVAPQVAGSASAATLDLDTDEVAATSEVDATCFPERKQNGSGVAGSSPPSSTYTRPPRPRLIRREPDGAAVAVHSCETPHCSFMRLPGAAQAAPL
jgi:hypothetical protein